MGRLVVLPLCALFAATATPARAQEAATPTDPEAEARQHFYSGSELFGEGDYEAALAEFETSWSLLQSPVALFNVAQTLRSLDRYAEAVDAFERYLRAAGDDVPDEQRARVRNTIESLQRRIAPVRLEVRPRGARVLIDGREVGTAPLPEPLRLAAGRRVIEVEADGFLSLREEISVVGREARTLEIQLARQDTAATLRVTTVPESAQIRIDGLEVGEAPVTRRLPNGGHVVEVTRDGYQLYRASIELAPQQELDLSAVLEVESDDGLLSQWWFWTAASVVAVAIVVGVVVLAQPGEPDPVPGNSYERVIEL